MLVNNDPLAGHQQLYTLENNKPVRCANAVAWLEWMNNTSLPAERTVLTNNRVLVTTFMGYAGDRRESQPLTFATVLKPEPQLPEFAVTLEWYHGWDEAKAGHQRFAEQFARASQTPEKFLHR